MNTQNSNTGKFLAIIGACLQVCHLIVMTRIAVKMWDVVMLTQGPGIGDTSKLANTIGDMLVAAGVGISCGLISLILILVSLFACRYRAAWLYWFLVIYSVIYLFAIPVGTVIGIVFLIYLLTNRNQFLAHVQPSPPPTDA